MNDYGVDCGVEESRAIPAILASPMKPEPDLPRHILRRPAAHDPFTLPTSDFFLHHLRRGGIGLRIVHVNDKSTNAGVLDQDLRIVSIRAELADLTCEPHELGTLTNRGYLGRTAARAGLRGTGSFRREVTIPLLLVHLFQDLPLDLPEDNSGGSADLVVRGSIQPVPQPGARRAGVGFVATLTLQTVRRDARLRMHRLPMHSKCLSRPELPRSDPSLGEMAQIFRIAWQHPFS